MSPVWSPRTRPDLQKVSHTDSPRPSTRAAPSTWNADVAAPQTNPSGKVSPIGVSTSGSGEFFGGSLVSIDGYLLTILGALPLAILNGIHGAGAVRSTGGGAIADRAPPEGGNFS